jgi:hypothetical protein
MAGEAKVALLVVGALAAVAAGAAIVSASSPAPAPQPQPPAPGGGTTQQGGTAQGGGGAGPPPITPPFKLANQINPGDLVRVTMTAATFDTIVQSLGAAVQQVTGTQGSATGVAGAGAAAAAAVGLTPGAAWVALLRQLPVWNVLQPGSLQTWAPGDTLPADWPPDDVDAQSNYHAQFRYEGTVPLTVKMLPLPLSVWTSPQPTKAPGHL